MYKLLYFQIIIVAAEDADIDWPIFAQSTFSYLAGNQQADLGHFRGDIFQYTWTTAGSVIFLPMV